MPPSPFSSASFLLLLAAAPAALAQSSSQLCGGATYFSYSSASCAPCSSSASSSSQAGCAPPLYGPADAAFYLSGAQDEGSAALGSQSATTPAYTLGPFGRAGGATVLSAAAPSLLQAPSAPAALPTGTAAWTLSAHLKCAAPAGRAGVIEWGAVDDSLGTLSPQAAALVVAGAASAVGAATVVRVCDNSWHHVAVVNTPSVSLATFVDGAQQSALPIGAPTGYLPGADELGACRAVVAGMRPFLWLDPANAAADGAGTLTAWSNAPEGLCTGAGCVTLSPALVASNLTTAPTVGYGKPLVTSVMPKLATNVAQLGGRSAVAFSATVAVGSTLATGSFANLAPLPSNFTVTATNSASTMQPTLPAIAFPFLISYIAMYLPNPLNPAATVPFNTTDQGRVLGGTYSNQIFGLWSNKFAATYSDCKGGPANSTTAQGWLPAATGAALANTPYLITLYCSAARACRLFQNGALINSAVAPVGWANALSINTPLNSCCRNEMSNFYVGDLIATAGVAYTDLEIANVNQYMNLKYNLGLLRNAAGIGGLGYNFQADIVLPAASSSTLRVGWSGNASAPSAFAGALAELRVYSRALSATEVLALSQPPILSFAANTNAQAVSPALGAAGTPVRGTTTYSFTCASPAAGNGGNLVKSPTDGSWGWFSGVVPSCVLPTPTASPTGSPSVSSSPTATISVTPSLSTTSTSSLSPTPTTTPSLSATPSTSRSPSQTTTPTNTPTPSQSPSPTSVPNVLVGFSFTIGVSGSVLRPSDVTGSRVLAAVSSGYASVLGVPPATVLVRNVTDIATGAVTVVSAAARRLGGQPGSAGVRFDVQVDLGKTPSEGAANAVVAKLSSAASAAQPLAAVVAAIASSTSLAASSYSAAFVASSVGIANSPFLAAAPAPAASDGGGGGAAGATGGIVGGIVGALALACVIWGARSYAKHGKLPCFRDRRKELVYQRQVRSEEEDMARAIEEAEAISKPASEAAKPAALVMRPSKPKLNAGAAAASVRKLAQGKVEAEAKASAAAAELEALKKQLQAAKGAEGVDPEEVAAMRAQLRAMREAAAAMAGGGVPAAAPAAAAAAPAAAQRSAFPATSTTENPAFAK